MQNTPEYQSLVYNPRAICELLVPHLEAHLSSEPGARLLVLRYSPETLPMVLNLRHVLSDTVMKVTAIVDPTRAALPGFRQPSTYFADVQSNSISTNHTMNQRSLSTVRGQSEPTAAVVSRSTRSRTRANRSGTGSSSASAAAAALTSKLFAQADFTIGSTAPEPEQDEFLAAIRAVLAQKNSFFEAEPEPKPVVLPAPKPVEVIKYVERIVHVPVPMVGNAASDAIAVAAAVQQHTASAGGGANTPTTAAGPSAYPNRNIGSKNEGSGHGMPSSSGGKHDRAWSFVPSVMPSRRPSNVSMMTTRSRRTTNGNNGPRDPNDPWELWHEDEEEERMLQLLLNPEKPTRRNTNWRNPNKGNPGNSRKALKWLGIIA